MIGFIRKYLKLLIIAGIVILILVISSGPFEPIRIIPITLLWLVVAYLALPQFVKKYRIPIFIIFAFAFVYFFAFNLSPNYLDKHHINFVNLVVLPFPIFGLLWVYEQWLLFKTLQADKIAAELALLKTQVNPHFLFNTLNNLYGLVIEKSDQAPEVVLKLSNMMRYTIYQGKEELVNLGEEVKYLSSYIELHKIRYQKNVDFQFTHEVDKGIQIAPLLFIILLENSIKHGIESKTENAFVHLHLKGEGNKVIFNIKNNYESMNKNSKAGIGLDNLKKRLEHIYPDRHALIIEKSKSNYSAQLRLSLN